jgi:hypothetical protein
MAVERVGTGEGLMRGYVEEEAEERSWWSGSWYVEEDVDSDRGGWKIAWDRSGKEEVAAEEQEAWLVVEGGKGAGWEIT